jgi:hypothetical protein
MTGTNGKDSSALTRLNEALIEDILAASDEAIIAEVRQDGADPQVLAAVTRALFERAVASTKKAALAAARAAVAADRRRRPIVVPSDPAEARRRWELVVSQHPDTAGKLTMAARKGKSGDFSDEEIRGLLEDFDDLGLSPDGKPDRGQ